MYDAQSAAGNTDGGVHYSHEAKATMLQVALRHSGSLRLELARRECRRAQQQQQAGDATAATAAAAGGEPLVRLAAFHAARLARAQEAATALAARRRSRREVATRAARDELLVHATATMLRTQLEAARGRNKLAEECLATMPPKVRRRAREDAPVTVAVASPLNPLPLMKGLV
eukprot:Rhum_TRINITY_DN5475_c0_g1::Rhum_TRINITY_DN5475_c0_g1_i1::g.17505::m.17505